MDKKYRVFKYERKGSDQVWEVYCHVHNNDNVTFSRVTTPPGTSTEIMNMFLEEAEVAIQKKISDSIGKAAND